jgi:hypothetical protein
MKPIVAGLLAFMTCVAGAAATAASFSVTPRNPAHVRLIAYGDQRFTDVSERDASRPFARQALVRGIAETGADAVLMTGDVPWHGGTVNDYAVYAQETAVWRERQIEIFPALGNHEFAGCAEAECLAHWWSANPRLNGLRWYSADIGAGIRAIALDSARPLGFGSEQRRWLENELDTLPASARFVVLFLHHPPVAAREFDPLRHNVRPNEVVLADYLGERAKTLSARLVVVAGHIHNYEHRELNGVTYLVSGGGGAKPYPVSREGDLFHAVGEPNFHFLTLDVEGERMHVDMHRLEDADSAHPQTFVVRDSFDVIAKSSR